jgi:hypothetical protein
MRWAGHVASIGNMKNAYKILIGKPEQKRPAEDLGIEGKVTLQLILGKQGGKMWTGIIWLRIGTSGRLF